MHQKTVLKLNTNVGVLCYNSNTRILELATILWPAKPHVSSQWCMGGECWIHGL